MIKLNVKEIVWALKHIEKHGETDILPPSYELPFLVNDKEFITYLSNIDLENYHPDTPVKIPTPKTSLGFRLTSKPDVVDNILFTALIYTLSKKIEKARVNIRKKIACSYRINPTLEGDFFHKNYGYKDFISKSVEYAQKASTKYILQLDISDFYNQISHHRIQNNLEKSISDNKKSKLVEKWLNHYSSKQHSQGIPVGPSSSIILAEVALVDLDNYLLTKNIIFTRYVDDLHILCRSFEEAISNLHLVTEYLYNSHRLTINSSKTRIRTKSDFLSIALKDPEKLENVALTDEIEDLISEKWDPYDTEDNEIILNEDEQNTALRNAISKLFNKVVEQDYLPLGLARYVLRRSYRLRTDKINKKLCENIDKFLPIFKDVYDYWYTLHSKPNQREAIRNAIKYLMEKSPYRNTLFVQWWVLELLVNFDFINAKKAFQYCEKCETSLKEKYKPFIAMKYQNWEVIRNYKENWSRYNKDVKRSILIASQILPADERKHWLRSLDVSGDYVSERLVKLMACK